MGDFEPVLAEIAKNLAGEQEDLASRAAPAACDSTDLRGALLRVCEDLVKIVSNVSKILAKFCIQYSLFQHFQNR